MLNQNRTTSNTTAMSHVARGRGAIWTIFILSVVNMITIMFSNSYFLFSAYIPQVIAGVGKELYAESGAKAALIVTFIIGIIVILPYLFFGIFSKERKGVIIAALVLFIADSCVFMYDFVLMLASGYISSILDLIIRVVALVELALAVKWFNQAKIDSEALLHPAVGQEDEPAEAVEPEAKAAPAENQDPNL